MINKRTYVKHLNQIIQKIKLSSLCEFEKVTNALEINKKWLLNQSRIISRESFNYIIINFYFESKSNLNQSKVGSFFKNYKNIKFNLIKTAFTQFSFRSQLGQFICLFENKSLIFQRKCKVKKQSCFNFLLIKKLMDSNIYKKSKYLLDAFDGQILQQRIYFRFHLTQRLKLAAIFQNVKILNKIINYITSLKWINCSKIIFGFVKWSHLINFCESFISEEYKESIKSILMRLKISSQQNSIIYEKIQLPLLQFVLLPIQNTIQTFQTYKIDECLIVRILFQYVANQYISPQLRIILYQNIHIISKYSNRFQYFCKNILIRHYQRKRQFTNFQNLLGYQLDLQNICVQKLNNYQINLLVQYCHSKFHHLKGPQLNQFFLRRYYLQLSKKITFQRYACYLMTSFFLGFFLQCVQQKTQFKYYYDFYLIMTKFVAQKSLKSQLDKFFKQMNTIMTTSCACSNKNCQTQIKLLKYKQEAAYFLVQILNIKNSVRNSQVWKNPYEIVIFYELMKEIILKNIKLDLSYELIFKEVAVSLEYMVHFGKQCILKDYYHLIQIICTNQKKKMVQKKKLETWINQQIFIIFQQIVTQKEQIQSIQYLFEQNKIENIQNQNQQQCPMITFTYKIFSFYLQQQFVNKGKSLKTSEMAILQRRRYELYIFFDIII